MVVHANGETAAILDFEGADGATWQAALSGPGGRLQSEGGRRLFLHMGTVSLNLNGGIDSLATPLLTVSLQGEGPHRLRLFYPPLVGATTGVSVDAGVVVVEEGGMTVTMTTPTTVVPPALPVQVAVYSGRVALSGGVNRVVSPADFFFSYSSSEAVTVAVEADSEAQFSHPYWSFSATEGTVVIDDDELRLLDGEMAIWVSTHVTLVRSPFVTVHTTEGVQMDIAYPVSGGQKTSIGLYWGTVTIYVAGAAATYLEDVVFHADATGGDAGGEGGDYRGRGGDDGCAAGFAGSGGGI